MSADNKAYGATETVDKTNGTTHIKIKPLRSTKVEDCGCQDDPEESTMIDNIPCCDKLHDKFGFKLFVFLLVFCLDAADLISDWLLYHDVSQTEEGLVYGPVENATKYSLLAFSVVGSLTFTLEVINLWLEIFRKRPFVDTDLLSAIIVWVEDVPQIIINVVIAACREDAISYFQLVKASVIILGAVIRVVVSLIRYCSKKARRDLRCAGENKESCRHVTYRVFIMIGLFITLAGAITVFLFTQSERNPNGTLNFKVPHSLIEGEWDDSKYFRNVSIYFSHPLFDKNHTGVLQESEVNWIRLASVPSIRNSLGDTILNITYENVTATQIRMLILGGGLSDCVLYDRLTNSLTSDNNCNSFPTTAVTYIFQFHYISPKTPVLIFGDISYDVKIKSNGQCAHPDSGIFDSVDGRLENTETEKRAAVHYFRTKDTVTDEYHVIHGQPNWQFFRTPYLTDITEVWRVGFASCKSSGSLAPHRDTGIDVKCP